MRRFSFMSVLCLIGLGCGRLEPPGGAVSSRSPAPSQQSDVSEASSSHGDSIIGFWRVVEASADGEGFPEKIGTIYEFRSDNTLRFVSLDNEGIQEYRMDAHARPKILVSWYFDPEIAGSGIYELNRDTLRWRTTLDEQDLRFSEIPQGRWWEFKFVRVTAEAAEAAIESIREERPPTDG